MSSTLLPPEWQCRTPWVPQTRVLADTGKPSEQLSQQSSKGLEQGSPGNQGEPEVVGRKRPAMTPASAAVAAVPGPVWAALPLLVHYSALYSCSKDVVSEDFTVEVTP